jgi:Rrf2 family protein
LADAVECPEQFLSKVLQSLTRAGLITSHRGNTGGFELPPVHWNASILEIVEAVEGPIRLNTCLNGQDECGKCHWCPAYPVWNEAQKARAAVLRGATIGELAPALSGMGRGARDSSRKTALKLRGKHAA